MGACAEIPVVGVFYKEDDHFLEWFASIEEQRGEGIVPVPVVVINQHPKHVANLKAMAEQCVRKGHLLSENRTILDWNAGHTVAFNTAIKQFINSDREWPWIASLDPDARFAPKTLHRLLAVGEQDSRVGMVSPIVIKPREDRDFRRPVAADETVCHAGHFPFQSTRRFPGLINRWKFHFKKCKVDKVCAFLKSDRQCAPFTACLCASLWNSGMLRQIGLPDESQFRTLNCGEIGYRAQLHGWSGRFASDAFAFHPNPSDDEYSRDRAMAECKNDGTTVDSRSTAWHFYHAQGLIALKYFPDELRNVASYDCDRAVPWESYFRDLRGIEPAENNASRQAVFDRWHEFKLGSGQQPHERAKGDAK